MPVSFSKNGVTSVCHILCERGVASTQVIRSEGGVAFVWGGGRGVSKA